MSSMVYSTTSGRSLLMLNFTTDDRLAALAKSAREEGVWGVTDKVWK